MTNTITVSLPDELIKRVDARVQARGSDRNQAIQELIERGLRYEEPPHTGLTLAELLSCASGPSPADEMNDEELEEFAEAEVKAYRAEKRQKATR